MQKILQKLSSAFEDETDVAFSYLFGSVAKGRSGPLSDVDVAVYFSPQGDARSRFRRQIQLISKLSHALDRDDIDVVRLQDAPLDLAREVVENGKLLVCRDDNLRVDFVFRVVRDYLDAEPLRKLEWEALKHILPMKIMVVRPDVIRARLKKLREMLAELKKIHSCTRLSELGSAGALRRALAAIG